MTTPILSRPSQPTLPNRIAGAFGFWFSFLGFVMSLLSSIEPLIILSNWARFCIDHWNAWVRGFWNWLLTYVFRVNFPDFQAEAITVALFIIALGITSSNRYRRVLNQAAPQSAGTYKSAPRSIKLVSLFLLSLLEAYLVYGVIIKDPTASVGLSDMPIILGVATPVLMFINHELLKMIQSKEKPWPPYLVLLTAIPVIPAFAVGTAFSEWLASDAPFDRELFMFISAGYIIVGYVFFAPPFALLVADIGYLTQRILFAASGLAVLLALNALSVHSAEVINWYNAMKTRMGSSPG